MQCLYFIYQYKSIYFTKKIIHGSQWLINYHEKSFKNVDLNNNFYKQDIA